MLKTDQVQLVKELRATGLSQREISRETGFARETVRGIINGKRPDNARQQVQTGGPADEENVGLFEGQVNRCPTCGVKVYMPCLACQIRAGMQSKV